MSQINKIWESRTRRYGSNGKLLSWITLRCVKCGRFLPKHKQKYCVKCYKKKDAERIRVYDKTKRNIYQRNYRLINKDILHKKRRDKRDKVGHW